jgi:hypothetical protein
MLSNPTRKDANATRMVKIKGYFLHLASASPIM